MNKNIFLLFVSSCILFSFGCAPDVKFVSQTATGTQSGESWEDAYNSISQAVASVEDHYTEIWVASGEYQETVTLKNKVKLYGGFRGDEAHRSERNWLQNKTVIDAAGGNEPAVSAQDILAITSGGFTGEVNGFTISNSQNSGIRSIHSELIVANCLLSENSGMDGGGMYFERSTPTIHNTSILRNSAEKGGGIYAKQSSLRISNSILAMNYALSGGGVYVEDDAELGMINCTIASNQGNGIECWSGSLSTILNSIVWNPGIQLTGDSAENARIEYSCIQNGWMGNGNIDVNPSFMDGDLGDFHLTENSPCIDAGNPNEFWNDAWRPPGLGTLRCDMGAYGGPDNKDLPILLTTSGTLYVRADAEPGGDGLSWDTAMNSIRKALSLHEYGEIWVAAGTYDEPVTMKPDVALFGGFGGFESTVDERDWKHNETIITTRHNETIIGKNRAVLDGFTVKGGKRNRIKCTLTSPTIINCTITNDGIKSESSGVFCDQSSATFKNCNIVSNSAENDGSGIYCNGASQPTFINCVIQNNAGTNCGGVVCNMGAMPTFINCIIASNSLTGRKEAVGGGVHVFLDPPTLVNCIITNNDGYGIYIDLDSATVKNCIVWNNEKGSIAGNKLEDNAFVTYSCVEGGWLGEGNIDEDPMFVDPENGDYRLQDGSPCIDRGIISAAPTEDVVGSIRPGSDGMVDMGAFESPPEFSSYVSVIRWNLHE